MAEGTRGLGRALRQIAPWAVAAGIITFLLWRTPHEEFLAALAGTSVVALAAVAAVFVSTTLAADSVSLWLAFRRTAGASVGFVDTLLVRGTSYLFQLVSFGAGVGGVVWLLRRRHRVPVSVGAGGVLLATGVFLIVVTAAVSIGLLLGAIPDRPELRLLAIAACAGIPVYLAVIHQRPGWLARRRLLRPLFDAGVAGTLEVAAARSAHVAVLIAGHLAAMSLFGIDVPVEAAITRLPVVFLIGSLPISPSGLGTTQAAAVALFADFAPGSDLAAQEATVLAYSLAFQVLGAAAMVLWSLCCLHVASRRSGGETIDDAGANA